MAGKSPCERVARSFSAPLPRAGGRVRDASPIVLLLVLVLGLGPALAAESDLWLDIPIGTTPLTELGSYRVAYQLYDGPRVDSRSWIFWGMWAGVKKLVWWLT